MKNSSGCCYHACGEACAPLVLRLALAGVFLPAGFKKVFTAGYLMSAEKLIGMSNGLVPTWLAYFVGYTLPIVELYIGLALLLGFGKYVTKALAVLTTFALVIFWVLKQGADYTWLSNVHSWYFIAAVALSGLSFGCLSLDNKLWPEEKK